MNSATTTPAPPEIHRDVEVTVTSSVAAELIARGGIKPCNPLCWERRDGRVTDDPRWALTDALVILAEQESGAASTEREIPAAPRIYGDVTVALTSTVAAELIAHAGIVPGSAYCWRLPDGSQTTDPRTALTDALVVIAGREPASLPAAPTISGDVTITVAPSVAAALLQYAGLERSDDGTGWRTRDGRESCDVSVALIDALVAIAEDDLAAEFIEPAKDDAR